MCKGYELRYRFAIEDRFMGRFGQKGRGGCTTSFLVPLYGVFSLRWCAVTCAAKGRASM